MGLSIAIAAVLAAVLTIWLARSWKLGHLQISDWRIFALAAGLFWGCLALILHLVYWDSYYRFFVPAQVNRLTPMAALFYALVGLGLRWLARRLPGNFAGNFCLLGACESIPEHILGIYRFHILEIPILKDVPPTAIFFFAFFEYALYWGAVLWLTDLLSRLLHLPCKTKPPGKPAV